MPHAVVRYKGVRVNRSEHKIIAEYLLATQNEIAIDQSMYALCGLSPKDFGFAPRPSKLVAYARYRVLLHMLMVLLRTAWRWGGARLLFRAQCKRLRAQLPRQAGAVGGGFDAFALGFSARAAQLITAQLIGDRFCWVTLPWVPVQLGDQPAMAITDLLDQADLEKALGYAIAASRKLNTSAKTARWGLQSYTAFRWFCVRLALEKLHAKTLLIAEHYDRWAILADRVMWAARARDARTALGIVLVQHGALEALGDSGADPPRRLPVELACRLRSVETLYAFDQGSVAIIRDAVLSPLCRLAPDAVRLYSPVIHLRQMQTNHPLRLLFVGHPVCETLHVHIIEALGEGISSYYKPHPANPSSARVNSATWTVIHDKTIFPEVDLLISYPSTLVKEYEGVNIPAIIHPLNMPPADAGDLIESIKRAVELLARQKEVHTKH